MNESVLGVVALVLTLLELAVLLALVVGSVRSRRLAKDVLSLPGRAWRDTGDLVRACRKSPTAAAWWLGWMLCLALLTYTQAHLRWAWVMVALVLISLVLFLVAIVVTAATVDDTESSGPDT